MHCLKRFWLNLFILLAVAPVSAAAKPDCLQQGKTQFTNKQYTQAKETFRKCVAAEPNNADALLSLAGVELTLDELDSAEKTFQAALKVMERTSPYLSYTYSMLGDIALKHKQNNEALAWYTKSLEYNAANVNSLVGKGVITEYKRDKKGAAEFYRAALAVEPLNLVARQRLISLEPNYFSEEEILIALKQRHAIKPDEKKLTPALRKLFTDIHQAEQRRGTDYLKRKYAKVPDGYLVTLNPKTDFERDLLTLEGYNVLQKHIGQDAVEAFRNMGVKALDVPELRDLNGKRIFNADNTLTENGFVIYTQALQKRKLFLRPDESVPPTKEKLEQLARREEDLKQAGYIEISAKEFKMLGEQTKCSEQTLRNELGVQIVKVNKKKQRYFILAQPTKDPKKGVPYYYYMKEQARHNPAIKVPANSLVESYAYYGYSVCLSDGNLIE